MKTFVHKEKLMGTAFSLGVVAEDEQEAKHWLKKGVDEIKRIENLLSEYKTTSVTSNINAFAEERKVAIDEETFSLLERSIAISKLTKGDFDITVGPLKRLFNFKNTDFEMPSKSLIKKTLDSIGFQNIILNKEKQEVAFKAKDMKISFNAIGKGYASDRVKKLWKGYGVISGFINASGDLTAFGQKPYGSHWNIGIANPDMKKEALLNIPLVNASVATSGDYEQYFLWRGKRYSHNINPHTGMPLSGIKSVTVVSPSAELSDALATAVYVKGVAKGLEFINQLPQTYCIIINDDNQLFFSKKMAYENPVA
ncbi:FAD:protein FMN transferase [Hyunsoonleella sp. SJ7]|uniref:FAD:protein FMN transferase n=1 Tax=Hyunsoonleella aquatilis TaxID=2762758 RepID=A0A923H928_9FLAO|nr:FAD:protein FMN transferase [Hyunsoonleella aquatilis]MBC3759481.1 FAD:protein FMN transferase [Hyunsoonleella aquatilis]